MWKNYGRARQATDGDIIRFTRTARWMTKATDTHTEYVTLIAFPLQQWLHEHTSVLRYTYIGCLVIDHHHHHHHHPPWIRSLDLFRHRSVAIVSWGVHDLFFPLGL